MACHSQFCRLDSRMPPFASPKHTSGSLRVHTTPSCSFLPTPSCSFFFRKSSTSSCRVANSMKNVVCTVEHAVSLFQPISIGCKSIRLTCTSIWMEKVIRNKFKFAYQSGLTNLTSFPQTCEIPETYPSSKIGTH